MPKKLEYIQQLYKQTLKRITETTEKWQYFLRTAAFQYKYPFADQVLIHAQKTGARACAEIELWNKRFDRWVNRGATGIALIREKGAKYTNAMPLYRLEKEMEQMGLHIPRQNMAHWVIQCADTILYPVYLKLKQLLCQQSVVQADETTVEVSKDGRPAGSKSYMWVYRTSELIPETPVILYDYRKTRNSTNPEEFLEGFQGTLMCDGFSGYSNIWPTIELCF